MMQTMQFSNRKTDSLLPSTAVSPAVTSAVPALRTTADPNAASPIATHWINRFFSNQVPISRQDISKIVHFHFLCDLFERLVCEKITSLSKLDEVMQKLPHQGRPSSIRHQQCLAAYRERYLNNEGTVSWRLQEIYFHSCEEALLVRNVLENPGTQNPTLTLIALLLLTCRYRNMLLCRTADWSLLPGRLTVLDSASQLLMQFLDCWQDSFSQAGLASTQASLASM